MGCNRTLTAHDLEQILASTDILDEVDNPEALDTNALATAVANYGESTVGEFVSRYDDVPEYANAALDSLNQVAGIEGMEDVVRDLTAGGTKAQGAEFQLGYVMQHQGEIAAVSVPDALQAKDGHWYPREGIDVLNKDGSVTELKSYDHTKDYYRSHADQVAKDVVAQARSRVDTGAPHTTVVFAAWYGPMSEGFSAALDAAIGGDSRIDWRIE